MTGRASGASIVRSLTEPLAYAAKFAEAAAAKLADEKGVINKTKRVFGL